MIELVGKGMFIRNGIDILSEAESGKENSEKALQNTMAYKILSDHNKSKSMDDLELKFDALVSHDITYVSIIQTAKASGLKEFPLPYVLTNCHNSLCAVGGTINEDDHLFGLSAAKKYGGIFVPANLAVIHQYAREMLARCGAMILGSDSHTRYGPLGVIGVGEGGPELVKQLLSKSYDLKRPEVVAVYLEGQISPGVGPMDVALAIIKAVFENGFVKGKIMEFIGPGIEKLSVDFRNGIDVMTTETTCLSSIWITDQKVSQYYKAHFREDDFKPISPEGVAYYDSMIHVKLDQIEPMIALPFHPSNVYTIRELNSNTDDILALVEKEAEAVFNNPGVIGSLRDKIRGKRVSVEQGIVAGCAGGILENMQSMAAILDSQSTGCDEFHTVVYPASQPLYSHMIKTGTAQQLIEAGVVIKPAFCGPCFGAGDTPASGTLSIRATTRNFPNREGSKPSDGQFAYVALMDARSIAATAAKGGMLTGADELKLPQVEAPEYHFENSIYGKRVFNGYGKAAKDTELRYGPNIADWPDMIALPDNLLLTVSSFINDRVTTTDELIPSGETSSYRSNPYKLAEFTLSRKDPAYVGRAKSALELERERQSIVKEGKGVELLEQLFDKLAPGFVDIIRELGLTKASLGNTAIGSLIYAVKPGDGSAREQAASCQKILGGWANISKDYATKRYRSNLINWGMIPFILEEEPKLGLDDCILIPGIRKAVLENAEEVQAYLINNRNLEQFTLKMGDLSVAERHVLAAGSLINYYREA